MSINLIANVDEDTFLDKIFRILIPTNTHYSQFMFKIMII